MTERIINLVIFRHNGEEWIAQVGATLKTSDNRKKDPAVVKSITHDRDKLYRIHTTALPGMGNWENPFLATVEDDEISYK